MSVSASTSEQFITVSLTLKHGREKHVKSNLKFAAIVVFLILLRDSPIFLAPYKMYS